MLATRFAPTRFGRGLLQRFVSTPSAPLLVAPSQVASLPSTVFVDASWVMPTSPRKPKEEFIAHRIPKAQFLDIDEVASHTDNGERLGLKHMMPKPQVFAQACDTLGITSDSHVVLYDTQGCFSSPRALFMFRAFSHSKSSVLNGGLPRWIDEGLPVETGPPKSEAIHHGYNVNVSPPLALETNKAGSYPVPNFNDGVIRTYEQIVTNSSLPLSNTVAELVLDARSRGRYLGIDPEPRPNLRSGHIPRSFSLPFTNFVTTHKQSAKLALRHYPDHLTHGYTILRSPQDLFEELEKSVGAEYAQQIMTGQRRVVMTCGSGMTAAVLWLGLSSVLDMQHREKTLITLYDESWTGYAARNESKIVTGEEHP